MKKYVVLASVLTLTACGGGSGGGDHGENLTPAEKLFGADFGTDQNPTNLIERQDGAGFEFLSFGAWGKVYDIKKTSTGISNGDSGAWSNVSIHRGIGDFTLFDFLGQQKQDIQNNYIYMNDVYNANSTFVGPAIVYNRDYSVTPTTCSMHHGCYVSNDFYAGNSDYGTMKLQIGQDIDNWKLDFVMSNPDNNATIISPDANIDKIRFTSDRQNAAVSYKTEDRWYVGYGARQ